MRSGASGSGPSRRGRRAVTDRKLWRRHGSGRRSMAGMCRGWRLPWRWTRRHGWIRWCLCWRRGGGGSGTGRRWRGGATGCRGCRWLNRDRWRWRGRGSWWSRPAERAGTWRRGGRGGWRDGGGRGGGGGRPRAGGNVAQECAGALAARGAQVAVVEMPPGEVDRAILAARFGRVVAEATAVVSGVVSLLGLDEEPTAGHPVVPAGVAGTLTLVQALGDAGIGAPLWLLTCGAVAAGAPETLTSAVQAMVWGLGLAAGLEHPDRWGGLVDVPAVWDERVAERLCGVLAGCGEEQVAVRSSGVLARRLMRAPLPRENGTGPGWVPSRSVLVTGGTGSVGGHVARWLAGAGAGHVVL